MRPFLLIVLGILLYSCNNSQKSEPAKKEPDSSTTATAPPADPPPGVEVSDPNEARCNSSQGMKWSRVAKDCVILADLVTLQPADAATGANGPAHLIFDSVRVEIFLPTQESSVIIRKSEEPGEAETWKSGPLKLTQVDGKYRLEDEGKLLYQQR